MSRYPTPEAEERSIVPFARVDDIEVHYQVRGRGAPLLMLMGMGASGDMWGDEFLSRLARAFRLILVDNRGTGATPRGAAPYSIAQLAADGVGVLDAEGLSAAHVFGVSMGGMIAQELAVGYPERVTGLVLGCTSHGGLRAVPPRPEAFEGLAGGRPGERGASLVVTPEFAQRRPGLLARMAVRAMARPTPPAVVREQFTAITRFDVSRRLHRITAPTLVITGDRDVLIPPANSRLLARAIPGAQGVIVKDTGHCFFWEAPDRAANAITAFLAPLPESVARG